MSKYFLTGGAGFLGSHFVDALLLNQETEKVTIYDNFSSGKESHYQHHLTDARFAVIKGDIKSFDTLCEAMHGSAIVMHFASNPDIARAMKEPRVDFDEGIYLTYQILEAMRHTQVKHIIYTSGSGVYGELGETYAKESNGPLIPISTYGASKLAGEAFISSYCHMFGMSATVFRFANIVGPRQTHGVCYDFIRKLNQNSSVLTILGDGSQSKSYIHVDDVVTAVLKAQEQQKFFEVYNVATEDYISVRDIADITVKCLGLENTVVYQYTGGDRGWKGDIPIVRLNTDKIRALGWICQKNSREAIQNSVLSLIAELS